MRATERAGPEEIVITPCVVDGAPVGLPFPPGPVPVTSATIGHILRDAGVLFDVAPCRPARSRTRRAGIAVRWRSRFF